MENEMSAEIVPGEQIAIIGHFALTQRPALFQNWLERVREIAPLDDHIIDIEKALSQEVAELKADASYDEKFNALTKVLAHANVASVDFRYSETNNLDELLGEIQEVKDEMFAYTAGKVCEGQFIQFCRCLDYQSCVRDDWEASIAKLFINGALIGVDRNSPKYDVFDWKYRKPKST